MEIIIKVILTEIKKRTPRRSFFNLEYYFN